MAIATRPFCSALCAVAVSLAPTLARPAWAQHHHHGGHHGGHHGHHGHYGHHYGHYYGHSHYVSPSTIYVQPPVTSVVNTLPSFQGVGMVLSNPESEPMMCTLDGQSYTLQPGYEVTMKSKPTYTVSFHKGGNFGSERYVVRDGNRYNFRVTADAGWDLKEASAQVVAPPAMPAPTANVVRSATVRAQDEEAPPPPPARRRVEEPAPSKVAPPVNKGDTVEVTSARAEIRDGDESLASATRGRTFKVLDVKGNWVMVDYGQPDYGWINRRDLRTIDGSVADAAPTSVKKAKASSGHEDHNH